MNHRSSVESTLDDIKTRMVLLSWDEEGKCFSTSFITGTGFMKCIPMKRLGLATCAAISPGSPMTPCRTNVWMGGTSSSPTSSEKAIAVDVRVLAATNKDLTAMVEDGRFREDLYYRIAGISITIPPLRERRTDIAPLVKAMLEKTKSHNGSAGRISDEATR